MRPTNIALLALLTSVSMTPLATARAPEVESVFLLTSPSGHRLLDIDAGLAIGLEGRGLRVENDAWTWGLQLSGYGFAGQLIEPKGTPLVRTEGTRLTYEWGAGLEEWCVGGTGGLEHGFTLAHRPQGQNESGVLIFELDVLGGLIPEVVGGGRDVRFKDSRGVSVLDYNGLVVIDATSRELPASFARCDGGLRLSIDAMDAVYPIVVDPTVQLAYIKASNTDAGDHFGFSVAISGDTAVVGAIRESSAANVVNGDETDNSATSAGAAFVFVKNNGIWAQEAYLKASNADAGDFFGTAVAIDGDTIVVGARNEQSIASGVNGNQSDNSLANVGAAYVFSRSGTTWTQQAYLKASSPDLIDWFGTSVAISGDLVIVGAPGEDSSAVGVNGLASDDSSLESGAAYLFSRLGTTWTPAGYFKASNTDSTDNFGTSVAIEGNRLAIGAPFEDSSATGVGGPQGLNDMASAGAVYIFERPAVTWSQVAYLKASNTGHHDEFGNSLSLSGSTLVVGAWGEKSAASGVNGNQADDSLPNAGAAYVFVESAGTWSQQAYLKASYPSTSAGFGYRVTLFGDRIAVSSPGEDGGGVGIHADPFDMSGNATGAVYSFDRTSGSWQPGTYIKASNADDQDEFGRSLALDGSELFVGAINEAGPTQGVGGNQAPNTALEAGAVYAFDLASSCGINEYGDAAGANVAKLQMFGTPSEGAKAVLSLSDFNVDGVAMLFVSTAEAKLPLFGGTLWIDFGQLVGGGSPLALAVTVSGKAEIAVPVPLGLVGSSFYAQAVMQDPGQVGGFALTNGLEVIVCP